MDAQTLADAWLARLPAADIARAAAFTGIQFWTWIGAGLAAIAGAALIGRTGAIGRLCARLEPARSRPWLASAASAGLLALAMTALKTPIQALGAWRESAALGGDASIAGFWTPLAQAAGGILPAVTAAILLVPILQWLIRRAPRAWPWIMGAGLTAFSLAVGWAPYLLATAPALRPLPPGPVRDGLLALVRGAGTPATDIYLSPDPAFTADVTGGFGRAAVVVGPRLAAGPPDVARAMVGHVMGHYAHGDVFAIYLLCGLLALAALAAIRALWRPAGRLLGVSAGAVAGDPEALPALAALAVLALAIAPMASGAYLRWANVRADAYALDASRAPDGLAAGLEQGWDHEDVDPPWFERAVIYTHPPLRARLVHAMAWKAAHGG